MLNMYEQKKLLSKRLQEAKERELGGQNCRARLPGAPVLTAMDAVDRRRRRPSFCESTQKLPVMLQKLREIRAFARFLINKNL